MTNLGVIFPPDRQPEELREVALAAEESGVGELWLWEDCFAESGIATAAAVLAWTQRMRVGIGLLPVPLRNVALTAMEIATLGRLFPGRLLPGVGHGVLEWMGQVGARAQSPMTLLREYSDALRELLHGATASTSGRYVQLDDVKLTWPPSDIPPLLIGAVGPKTLELAGELGEGVIMTGATTLESLREGVRHIAAGRARGADTNEPKAIVVFVTATGHESAEAVAARVGEFAAAGATTVALHSVGDDAPTLVDFARFVGRDVRPLVP